MLNKLQDRQYQAFIERLTTPQLQPDEIDTSGDISLKLFSAYIDMVSVKDFVEAAIKQDSKLLEDGVDFFNKNRLAFIEFFEDAVGNDDNSTSILCMAHLIEMQSVGSDDEGGREYQEVTPHDIGFIVYGNEQQHAKYNHVAQELSKWVAMKSAGVFYDTANYLVKHKGELLITPEYRIDEFLDFQSKSIAGKTEMGWAQTKYILDTIDADVFAANALSYPDLKNGKRENGKISQLAYLEDGFRFYHFNRADTLNWLNDYIELGQEHHNLVQHNLLGSIHKWIKDIGLMPLHHRPSIHDIADILYANNKGNKHYVMVVQSLAILVVEVLTVSYQNFDQAEFDQL